MKYRKNYARPRVACNAAGKLRAQDKASPLRIDPTRTATLRRRWVLELRRRFGRLRARLLVLVGERNALGLTANADDWSLEQPADRARGFQEWLRQQVDLDLLGADARRQWDQYVGEAFGKGMGRGYDDVRRGTDALEQALDPRLPAVLLPSTVAGGAGVSRSPADYLAGGRDEFMRGAFGQPVAREKVDLLRHRVYSDLKGVTDQMSAVMARTLADGMGRGASPRELARLLSRDVDGVGRVRAETVARTETIRAHAEGQLVALRQLGVTELGVQVEWLATGDDRTCPACADMEGTVTDIDDASGQIPFHPNCRCCWVPAVGGGKDADEDRAAPAANVFCPTGAGGGVDPTCGAGGEDKAKFIGEKVGKEEHEHAARVEQDVAAALGGHNLEDNEPLDVRVPGDGVEHAVEVKSMLKGNKTSISVHDDALLRKVEYVAGRDVPVVYHTVVVDERGTYAGGAHAGKFSGHRVYYKRGSGRYSLSKMHRVGGLDELAALLAAPDARLPESAKGSLPSGSAVGKLRESARKAHASRLTKDRARKQRLREGRAAGNNEGVG